MKIDEKKVQKEAQRILDRFAEALVSVKDVPDAFVDRAVFERSESGEGCDPSFKEKFLANAPSRRGDHIVVEKKGWA